jgi:prenyltransferase beta subunit
MRTGVLILVVVLALPGPATAQMSVAELEKTVDQALDFLKSQQEADGSWGTGRGAGRHPALTGLAVMAFLSAGHLPGEGPYGEAVERGVHWVLGAQRPDGLFAMNDGRDLYHHGICTLMLAEVCGMTDARLAPEVKQKLAKAVAVVLRSQKKTGQHKGGWRYLVNSADADISVTGWQLLALRAAKNVGCDVPSANIDLAVDYMKRCREPKSGGFCYQPGGRLTVPCTGTCILGLELCGKDRHHTPEALQAGSYLLNNPPTWNGYHFFYGAYYGSQAMFQLGGSYWKTFRPKLHKVLLDNRRPNGCWIGNEGQGPVYGTALAVLSLTVENRLLPIYQRGEEPTEKSPPLFSREPRASAVVALARGSRLNGS